MSQTNTSVNGVQTRRRLPIRLTSRKERLSQLHISPGGLVLEVGSGDNPMARSDVLADRYLGYTPDREGRRIWTDKRPLVCCDGHHLPFQDQSFDYIIACQVLEYAEKPAQFLDELVRVGKRGYIEVANEVREVMFDWDDRKYMVSVGEEGRLLIQRKLGRSPFGELFRRLADVRLHAFLSERWSAFNYSLEWEGQIDYQIDEEGVAVTSLPAELDIELLDTRRRGQSAAGMDNLVAAAWAVTPGTLKSAVRMMMRSARRLRAGRDPRKTLSLEELVRIMACPVCGGEVALAERRGAVLCRACHRSYPIRGGIPIMLAEEAGVEE